MYIYNIRYLKYIVRCCLHGFVIHLRHIQKLDSSRKFPQLYEREKYPWFVSNSKFYNFKHICIVLLYISLKITRYNRSSRTEVDDIPQSHMSGTNALKSWQNKIITTVYIWEAVGHMKNSPYLILTSHLTILGMLDRKFSKTDRQISDDIVNIKIQSSLSHKW